MKKLLIAAYLVLLVGPGFATAKSSEQDAGPYVANFDYAPAVHAAPGSGGVVFAIGHSIYTFDPEMSWVAAPQFADLDKALQQDLTEILLARGFSLRGPFDSFDLIPYSDKKAIDLYLSPTIELFYKFKPEKTGWRCTGKVEANGRIIIELKEVVTGERMWAKSIPFKYEFPYDIHLPHGKTDLKPFTMDDLAKGLAQQYPDLMATVSTMIDPEEMGIIKKQARQLRTKKGY